MENFLRFWLLSPKTMFLTLPPPLTPLDFARRPLHILSKPIHSAGTAGQAVFLWWLSCGQHDHSCATPPIFIQVLLLSSHILMEIPPYSYLWQYGQIT